MNLKEQYESESYSSGDKSPAMWDSKTGPRYSVQYTKWLEEKVNRLESAKDILSQLARSISTIQLDMSGDHRYMLSLKSHKIITKAKAFLSEVE